MASPQLAPPGGRDWPKGQPKPPWLDKLPRKPEPETEMRGGKLRPKGSPELTDRTRRQLQEEKAKRQRDKGRPPLFDPETPEQIDRRRKEGWPKGKEKK